MFIRVSGESSLLVSFVVEHRWTSGRMDAALRCRGEATGGEEEEEEDEVEEVDEEEGGGRRTTYPVQLYYRRA